VHASRALGLTTRASAPPHGHLSAKTCPPPNWQPGGKGDRRWIPRSPCDRLISEVPSYTQLYPGVIGTTTPQPFAVASSPMPKRGDGVDLAFRQGHALHTGPHIRQVAAAQRCGSVIHWLRSRCSF